MLALVALAACTGLAHAHDNSSSFSRDALDRTLSFVFGEQDARWRRAASCARALGPAKCLNAFSVWRADNAVEAYKSYGGYRGAVVDELAKFPWEEYANVTEEALGEDLSEAAARLLQLRPLRTSLLPGYRLQLNVKNDALNVDVYKNDEEVEARGTMKKLRKKFYAIVPLLLIPGLVMSAVLPFVLPALKMSVLGAGMLNQMALTGAIFTLLRNNAFSDYYEKKVIYVNKGYQNEKKHRPVHIEEEIHSHTVDDGFYEEDGAWHHGPEITEYAASHDFPVVAEPPANADWINQYYGGEGFSHIENHPVDREYDTKRKRKTKLRSAYRD
ncbi:uncharacterized protein LOC105390400 [Plutella xylostella]|uniref:uncharacterized protein LOC105390400 n=1 Tax=Plutella xylostella TaxID=51655 RepID=UPI002032B221|nr:uncharacterized protein LOC105390400 [Plutella xylostella]